MTFEYRNRTDIELGRLREADPKLRLDMQSRLSELKECRRWHFARVRLVRPSIESLVSSEEQRYTERVTLSVYLPTTSALGLQVKTRESALCVASVAPGSPAALAGVLIGDVIRKTTLRSMGGSKVLREASAPKEVHQLLLSSSDAPLRHFLEALQRARGIPSLAKLASMELSDFTRRYREHCEKHDLPVDEAAFGRRGKDFDAADALLVRSYYGSAFASYGLRVLVASRPVSESENEEIRAEYSRDLQQFDFILHQRRLEFSMPVQEFEIAGAEADAEVAALESEKAGYRTVPKRTDLVGWSYLVPGATRAVPVDEAAGEDEPSDKEGGKVEATGADSAKAESAKAIAKARLPTPSDEIKALSDRELIELYLAGQLPEETSLMRPSSLTPADGIDVQLDNRQFRAIRELPVLQSALRFKYLLQRLTRALQRRDQADANYERANAKLEQFDEKHSERRKKRVEELARIRAKQLEKLASKRMERRLRVVGVDREKEPCASTDPFSEQVAEVAPFESHVRKLMDAPGAEAQLMAHYPSAGGALHVHAAVVASAAAADSSAQSPCEWHQLVEIQVERESILAVAASMQRHECSRIMLRHCGGEVLLLGVINRVHRTACSSPSSLQLLRQLLNQLPAMSRLSWLMGWHGRDALARCFATASASSSSSSQHRHLSSADGSLTAALEALGFNFAGLRERCLGLSDSSSAIAAADSNLRQLGGSAERGREVLATLRGLLLGVEASTEAAFTITTVFELDRIVKAAQEIQLPASPFLVSMIAEAQSCGALATTTASGRQVIAVDDGHGDGEIALFELLTETLVEAAEEDADEMLKDRLGPLHLAAALGLTRRVDALSGALPFQLARCPSLLAKQTPLGLSCVNGFGAFGVSHCLSDAQPPERLSQAMLQAAEHFQLAAIPELLALGASALSRDQHTGTSALDMIVRLGVQRGQLHFGVSGGDDVGEQQHACQQEEANQPQQGRPLLTAWSQTVASLVEQGADPLHAPRRGHAPIHYFLAYVPLHDWPPIVRSTLLEALDAEQCSPALDELWRHAGVHACALSPGDASSLEIARRLLELGACARAQAGTTKQTALHLLAAGGSYECAEDRSIVLATAGGGTSHSAASKVRSKRDKKQHSQSQQERAECSRRQSACQLATLLISHGADWRARDSMGNSAVHLACFADEMAMVRLLWEGGGKFGKPFVNRANKSPEELATEAVRAYLTEQREKMRTERERREQEAERLSAMGGGATSVDGLLSKGARAEVLLSSNRPMAAGGQGGALQNGGGRGPATPSTQQAGALSSDPAGANGSEAAQNAEALVSEQRTERLKLAASLRFSGQRWNVVLSRHSLVQLRLLHDECADSSRCHAALRLLHTLATDTASRDVLLDRSDATIGPVYYSSSPPARGSQVHVVWERSAEHFFEGLDLVRVWSIETTRDHLQECAAYVKQSWELGGLAESADDGQPFPMGTTSSIEKPSDTWHPAHAEEGTGGEVAVPFILKWFPLNDLLLRTFLVVADGKPFSHDIQLPMLLDQKECSIVGTAAQANAQLVLGRSGTGKTSVALQMLFELQLGNLLAVDDPLAAALRHASALPNAADEGGGTLPRAHVNALFLTKSHILTQSLHRQFLAMLHTLGLRTLPPEELKQAFLAGRPLPQPLFLSSSEWLVLLDESLDKRRFFRDQREADDFVREYSGSTDSLEALRGGGAGGGGATAAERRAASAVEGRKLLTFACFASWARQDGWESSGLSASSLYREIFSYIKGSAEAIACRDGFLTRAEYLALPSKMTNVTSAQREAVYDVFDKLRRRLRVKEQGVVYYDAFDLIQHLVAAIRGGGGVWACTALQRVFVDEVQDQTQAELQLLLTVTAEARGFVLFGDTAQTISRGVGFRFADVKQLFYRQEKIDPTIHQLACNYRTHHGIIMCSASVVGLLLKLFPSSIDALAEPERGHFPGPMPAMLPDVDTSSLVECMLAADDVGVTEMGANQAVLVRTEAAKARLPPELRNGLVLTVEESKGLEFDDVCIFEL